MNIEKSKIQEVWNYDHNKVIKYTQTIKNKRLNDSKEIVADNLNSLISKVRGQVEEWEK
ncbi:hypothetical protein [Clostridium sp.]|uniref:hypothetical protein n=1 Tax=Clostridium sp. TaxID=1506 RepID=UPI003F356A1C